MTTGTAAEARTHFFVALPEPMALPDGHTHGVSFHTPMDLHRWLNDSGRSHAEPAPWISPALYEIHLRFHRVPVSAKRAIQDTAFLLETARSKLPSAFPPPPAQSLGPSDIDPSRFDTVVQLIVPAEPDDGVSQSDYFDFALDCLRQLQLGYAATAGGSPMLVAREMLPPFVPVLTESADGTWTQGLFFVNPMAIQRSVIDRPTLNAAEIEDMVRAANGLASPFAAHLDLRREAEVNLVRLGNTRAAVVFANSAGEVLLDSLLQHLLWEEGVDPEEAAERIFHRQWFSQRLRSHFHNRLGGAWNVGAVRQWLTDCAAVRHRVAHSGYEPERGAARRALDVTVALIDFVVERLAVPSVVEKYPRTVLTIRGPRAATGPHGARLRALQETRREPRWDEMFGRWKHFHDARMRELAGFPLPAPVRELLAVLVVDGDGGPNLWYMRDQDNLRVRRCALPEGITEAEYVAALGPIPAGVRYSAAVYAPPGEPLEEEWTSDYKVLPNVGVSLGYPCALP